MLTVLKTINKSTGFIIETVAYDEANDSIYMYELSENEALVKEPLNELFIKPKWNGTKWVEGASDEEVQKYNEEKKEREKEYLKQSVSEIDELKAYVLDMELKNAMGGIK